MLSASNTYSHKKIKDKKWEDNLITRYPHQIPLININILDIIYWFLFQTFSLKVFFFFFFLNSHSLSEKRIDMENITTTTTTTSKYFFTLYLHLICLSNMHTVNFVVFFTIICKIKTKIHYEFTTIKTYKFNQQKTKKHYSCELII